MPDLSHFREVLETGAPARDAGSGRPVVGFWCNFVPEELIVAAGAIPVRLCGGDEQACRSVEDIFPRDVCPVARSSLGIIRDEKLGHLDLLVAPLVCDAKTKLAAAAAAHVPVHAMLVPRSKTAPGAQELWLEQVRHLKAALEEATGARIERSTLERALRLLDDRCAALRRLQELRRADPPPLTGVEFLTILGASFRDDPERWTAQVEALCEELERAPARGLEARATGRQPRLLLTGAPLIHPNFKLAEVIEAAGGFIVADDLCSGTQRLYNPVRPAEWTMPAMLRALAEATLLPSTCPCFADSSDRLTRLLELVRSFRVDGVIHHTLRLCALFDADALDVRAALRERGVPFLSLHTDYAREDTAQLRTRAEAFLELLAARRAQEVGSTVAARAGPQLGTES